MLSHCGFSPVYGTLGHNKNGAVGAQFSKIQISMIPDREGQYLKNALIDRLHRNGQDPVTRYRLNVAPILESTVNLDLTRDADSTRAQLRLRTTVQLSDTLTQTIVLVRPLTAIASYNILDSEFSTRVSEENTRLNALDELAEQIERQLALYFKRDSRETDPLAEQPVLTPP